MANKHLETPDWIYQGEERKGDDPQWEYLAGGFKGASGASGLEEVMHDMSGIAKNRGSGPAGVCAGCGRDIPANKRHLKDPKTGKKFHESCYQGELRCKSCNKTIVGATTTTQGGDHYHRKCFTCSKCSNEIGDDSYTLSSSGAIFCGNCGKRPAPSGSGGSSRKGKGKRGGSARRGGSLRGKKTNKASNNDLIGAFQNIQMGKETCPSCGDVIGVTDEAVKFAGQVRHKACAVCDECRKPFPNGQYAQSKDKFYCKSCAEEKLSPKCAKCNKPIVGSYLADGAKMYHPACM